MALWLILSLRALSSISLQMPSAKAFLSPLGHRMPSSPSKIMSFGPQGQVKETHGTPTDIASAKTRPNPSNRELNAKIELLRYSSTILLVASWQNTEFAT